MNRRTVTIGRTWIVLPAAVLIWAVIALFHPDPDSAGGVYTGLADEIGRWLFVHIAQLVLAPFVAFTVWMILQGITSVAASVSRAALVVWLVFFSVYDALAGVGTGVLVKQAVSASGDERAQFVAAADFFWDSGLAGTMSWWGVVATVAWPVVAVTAAVALRRAGAGWSATVATATSGLIAMHGGFPAAVGFAALAAAAVLRRREQLSARNPVAHVPVTVT